MARCGFCSWPDFCDGAGRYVVLTAICAVLIAVCRYLEGVFSHLEPMAPGQDAGASV
ncbi:MAG: hypothetical protein ACLUD2_17600 [Clostridium sp.]